MRRSKDIQLRSAVKQEPTVAECGKIKTYSCGLQQNMDLQLLIVAKYQPCCGMPKNIKLQLRIATKYEPTVSECGKI